MTQVNRHGEPKRRRAPGARCSGAIAAVVIPLLLPSCSSGGSAHAANQSVVGRTSSSAGSPAPTPSTLPAGVLNVVQLDPGAAPSGMVAGFGSLWINAHRREELYRVDPKTNKVIATLPVDDCCSTPAVGAGYVWAGTQVIDPGTNRVVGTLPASVFGAFAVIDGFPWAYAPNALASIDPTTFRVVRTVKVNANARKVSDPDIGVAYGDGAFWVIRVGDETGAFGGVVVKVDPRTGKVLRTYHPPDPGVGADIQFLDHAIWLKGDDSGRLVKLDTRTGASHVYQLPGWKPLTSFYPQTIALGYGDLWIRNSSDEIVRFRPRTGRVVDVYPGSPSGHGGLTAIAFGSVWVANFDDDTVWRDRITT